MCGRLKSHVASPSGRKTPGFMGHKGENSGGAQLWGASGPLPAVGPCPWEVGAVPPILVVRGARDSYPGDTFAVVERSW